MKESSLHQEASSVLDPDVLNAVADGSNAQPRLGSRVAQNPSNGLQDMAFHLNEGAFLVSMVASTSKLCDRRNSVFGVFKLCSNPERSTVLRGRFC